jgi:hypothetical protein
MADIISKFDEKVKMLIQNKEDLGASGKKPF